MSERALLVEIGTEELPPSVVADGCLPFARELGSRLERENFLARAPEPAHLCTPRRIAVRIEGVASRQPAEMVERKGPPATEIDGNNPAVKGFAKSCGVETDRLEIRDGRLCCRVESGGRTLGEVLPGLLLALPPYLRCERLMRWGAGEHAFARPVHWLCVLHGEEVIPCELFGTKSGRVSHGHRHHCSGPLTLEGADDYEEVLREKGRVIVDFAERKSRIESKVGTDNAKLADEAAATTEWPQVLTAQFDEAFLSLPCEVITRTLESGLKAFVETDADGKPVPRFLVVADVESEQPEVIARGYENVVRARLKDAEFFFEQDKKVSLEERRGMLGRTQFREKLGTLADKAERLEKLAAFVAPLCAASSRHVRRAAQLCKCDLGTDLVGEYPELQGIMGGYYAAAAEHETVASAIRDHYLPQGRHGRMPETPEGAALALADKADTLAGFWSIGLAPSSSRDPYGLRRLATDVLRIMVRRELDFDVAALTDEAVAGYGGAQSDVAAGLRGYMGEQLGSCAFVWSFPEHEDKTTDLVNAVAVADPRVLTDPGCPVDFFRRLDAVASFVRGPDSDSLVSAHKRIRNILRKADVKKTAPDPGIASEQAERDLFAAVNTCRAEFERRLGDRDHSGAMKTLAGLREPVDRFFDDVLVMSENERERDNRLALLGDIRAMFSRIADFSELNPNKPGAPA